MQRRPKRKIKELSFYRRSYGITSNERMEVESLLKDLKEVSDLIEMIEDGDVDSDDEEDLEILDFLEMKLLGKIDILSTEDPACSLPLPKIINRHVQISDFSDSEVVELFRFRGKDQLWRLLQGLKFEDTYIDECRNSFSGQEVLLAGLYRLCHLSVLGDGSWRRIFGWDQPRSSRAVKLFLKHMNSNCIHLIRSHEGFWAPRIPELAEAIRAKLMQLGDEAHGSAYYPGGFNVFGFIDCVGIATCRPGGGPLSGGPDAARKDPLIQRSMYNGWKKRHGIKYQTVDLPCGLHFNVWGPESIRHNDLESWEHSDVHQKVIDCQAGMALKFKIYGDSAYQYIVDDTLASRYLNPSTTEVVTNEAMSSCRECIEWHYGELKQYFKIIDYIHGMKLMQMDVTSIVNSCFILRNAHTCMNGNKTSEFFNCRPPTFEEYVSFQA